MSGDVESRDAGSSRGSWGGVWSPRHRVPRESGEGLSRLPLTTALPDPKSPTLPDTACLSLATSPRRAENQPCREGTALVHFGPASRCTGPGRRSVPCTGSGAPRQLPHLRLSAGQGRSMLFLPVWGPCARPALHFCLRQPVAVTCNQHHCPPAPLPSPQASSENLSSPLPRPGLQLPVRLSVLPTVGRSEPRLWCVNSFIYPPVHLPSRSAIHPPSHLPIPPPAYLPIPPPRPPTQ